MLDAEPPLWVGGRAVKSKRTIRVQAAVMRQDRILLVKHVNHRTGQVYWWLPGGGIEDGETPEEAVVREVREETQLEVVVKELILTTTDGSRRYDYHTYHTFLCDAASDAASPGSEGESAAVHSIVDVAWYPLWDEAAWEPGFAEPHLQPLLKSLQVRMRPR